MNLGRSNEYVSYNCTINCFNNLKRTVNDLTVKDNINVRMQLLAELKIAYNWSNNFLDKNMFEIMRQPSQAWSTVICQGPIIV